MKSPAFIRTGWKNTQSVVLEMIYINVHVFCLSSGIFWLSRENEVLYEKTSGNKVQSVKETPQFMFDVPVELWKLERDKGFEKKNCKHLSEPLFHVILQS